MDIITRLNIFVNYLGLTSTQFADEISVPRPSFSQILNGRNKKLSNEFISKVHKRYPLLNILWLLFGEGKMIIDSSNEKNENKTNIDSEDDLFFNENVKSVEDNTSVNLTEDSNVRIENFEVAQSTKTESINDEPTKSSSENISIISETNSKKINRIIIFYEDNTFDAYLPSENIKN